MSDVNLERLYKEVIRDHSGDPRNFGALEGANIRHEGFNPLCGDRIDIMANVRDGHVQQCQFLGEGCSICMASASIMTEEIQGKDVKSIKDTITGLRMMMRGEKDPGEFEGDLEALEGVRHFPVRIKCALLPWTTLADALDQQKGVSTSESETGEEGV